MSTEQLEKFQDEVEIPEGVTITQKKHMLTFVGPLGKTHQSFRKIPVKLEITDNLDFEDGDCAITIKNDGSIGKVIMPKMNTETDFKSNRLGNSVISMFENVLCKNPCD